MIDRVARKIKRKSEDLFFLLNLEHYLLASKKGAIILCYHGVDLVGNKSLNMRFYSKKRLETQFIYFKKYFNIISVQDYFDERFDNSKLNVAITFDDGYENNFKYLLPLVEKYELPVSLYITGINKTNYNFLWADFADIIGHYTNKNNFYLEKNYFFKQNKTFVNKQGIKIHDIIKNRGDWEFKELFFNIFIDEFQKITQEHNLDDYWKLMSDEEIKKINKSKYINIGSHGFFHNNLGVIKKENMIEELKESKCYLENLIQEEIKEIAFPDGSYNRNTINEAAKIGFDYQLALSYKHKDDLTDKRIVNRYGMYPVYSVFNEIAKLQSK